MSVPLPLYLAHFFIVFVRACLYVYYMQYERLMAGLVWCLVAVSRASQCQGRRAEGA